MSMPSGTFEILAVLSRGEGESAEVLDRIRRLDADAEPSLATFYRRLKAAVDEGWIEVVEVEPDGPGRPGRTLRITSAGTDAVRREADRRRRFDALLSAGGGDPV